MNKNSSIFNTIFYTAAFVLSCCFIYGCENDEKTINELTEKKVMVDEARDIETIFSQGGKIKANLKAPLMLRVMTDTQYVEFPNSLHADFYNDSTSQIESWVTSKYGKYYENYNKVYLRDSVVVITTAGDTLKSPDLWWDQDKGIFYTYHYAEYHGKDQVINGHNGMEATQDLKSISFKKPTGYVDKAEGEF
jgi:LPS export ABC transporter protein LptC